VHEQIRAAQHESTRLLRLQTGGGHGIRHHGGIRKAGVGLLGGGFLYRAG